MLTLFFSKSNSGGGHLGVLVGLAGGQGNGWNTVRISVVVHALVGTGKK